MIFLTNDKDAEFIADLIRTEFQEIEIAGVRKMNRGALTEISIYDKAKPIELEICEKVTEFLMSSPEFLAEFGNETALSVASPGLERKITTERELTIFVGKEVKVVYLNALNKTDRLVGTLKSNLETSLEILHNEEVVEIPKESIKKIRLYYPWAS